MIYILSDTEKKHVKELRKKGLTMYHGFDLTRVYEVKPLIKTKGEKAGRTVFY